MEFKDPLNAVNARRGPLPVGGVALLATCIVR